MEEQPVVQFRNTTKNLGKKVRIHPMNFEVRAGEIFGFLGPNGSGKTTTIRMMVGLVKISYGDILINGYSITKQFEKAIRHVGAIVENPDLYHDLTGYQNLQHFARMVTGVSRDRINQVVKSVNLTDRIHDKVSTYSLGMRQRLGIAQALLHRPSLLILDEPTNGLDVAGIRELHIQLKKLAHQEGVTVFLSSHLLAEMQQICDRIAVLRKGEIVRIVNIHELISKDRLSQVILDVDPTQIEKVVMLVNRFDSAAITRSNHNQLELQMNKEDIPALNKHLFDHDIRVFGIHVSEQTLEDQWLKIMEGES